jgi:uncharacterized membrane protein YphA (DoxX/SURF4 family)
VKKNMGTVDRAIRTFIAVVIGILLLSGQIRGTFAIFLSIFMITLLLTSAIGWCPLYSPFGISTRKTKQK